MTENVKRCPNCNMWSSSPHCSSPTCTWKVCSTCKIAFNGKGRSMAVKL